MTLDSQHDSADNAVREVLEELRRVLAKLYADSHTDYIDYLVRALAEDRQALFTSANGGATWRNMGSIADLGDRPILQALVQLADAMDAAHLASNETMAEANRYREWLAK